ncbi:MAG: GTPase ObgE [Anaerovoracaceae bacterium]
MFVDKAIITIKSGKGGDGAVSFRREPFVPDGGPDGGDGGKGGDVIFRANEGMRTLMDFRYKKKFEAEDGEGGMKSKKTGKMAKPLIIQVPVGTMIIDKKTGHLMVDFTEDGQEYVAATGGDGGRGNTQYKNSIRQAPNFAEAGGFSQERKVVLELKLIADVGLVGFPNVGKSSLLSVVTKARPKIANYHFTTIQPNLGVVEVGGSSFVIADIAGLIEGAHKGAGLGDQLLKHVERTKILIHVLDVSASEGRNPIEDFDKINHELSEYDKALGKKKQIVAANKIDLLKDVSDISLNKNSENITDEEKKLFTKEELEILFEKNDNSKSPGDSENFDVSDNNENLNSWEDYEEFKSSIISKGFEIIPISAATGKGVKELMEAVAAMLHVVEQQPKAEEIYDMFDPEIDDFDPDFRKIFVNVDDRGVYILDGKQLLKIFNSTNFNDIGSIRYLYRYIDKQGGVKAMKKLGLMDGDTVKIENYEFEWSEED